MSFAKLSFLAAAAVFALSLPSHAQSSVSTAEDVVSVELLSGWREPDGRHIAAVRLSLAEGWKTYWRAPGEGGLPTRLQWFHSDNLANLQITWPRPEVFDDNGLRSLGYLDQVVLPLVMEPKKAGDIGLNARLSFGVCKDVCVPVVADLRQVLKAISTTDIQDIQDALARSAVTGNDAGVRDITCELVATNKGHQLRVDVKAEVHGRAQAMVIETPDPEVWVGRTDLTISDTAWTGVTQLYDHRDAPSPVNVNDLRITLLTEKIAVDIRGCGQN